MGDFEETTVTEAGTSEAFDVVVNPTSGLTLTPGGSFFAAGGVSRLVFVRAFRARTLL